MITLGEMLYQERKKAGVSLNDVANATRIRMTLLQALEEGRLDILPDPGYVRGFISSYCRFLGVDARPFIDQYTKETDQVHRGRLDMIPNREAVKAPDRQHEIPWKAVAAVAVVVALLAIIVWGLSGLFGKKTELPPEPIAPTVQGSATSSTKDSTTGAAATNPVVDKAVDLAPFTLSVSVIDGGASDITVLVDGVEAFTGAMTSGQKESYEVIKTADLTVANPKHVRVKQNGTNIPVPSGTNVTMHLVSKKTK